MNASISSRQLSRPLLPREQVDELPQEIFHSPASITLIPFSRANLDQVKQVYEKVKRTFEKKSELALTFDEQTLSITFPYNEHEVHTILDTESLMPIICGSCTLTRNDLTMYVSSSSVFWVDNQSRVAFLKKAQKLDELAKAFFLHRKANQVHVDPKISFDTLVPTLLQEHQGFCLGEIHKERAAKKFLSDNMSLLKQQGGEHTLYGASFLRLDAKLVRSLFSNARRRKNAPILGTLSPVAFCWTNQL